MEGNKESINRDDIITLRQYVDMRFNGLAEVMAAHTLAHHNEHTFVNTALEKAEIAVDKRFATVNEFRQTLTDQATTFARAETVEAKLTSLQQRMEAFSAANQERIERNNKNLGDRIDSLEKQAVQWQGTRGGVDMTLRWFIAAIGILATLSTIISIWTIR